MQKRANRPHERSDSMKHKRILSILSLILVSFIPYESNAAPGQFYKPEVTNGFICLFFFL